MEKVCINHIFVDKKEASLSIENRSYRYGDGFFETIKIVDGSILFKELHQRRIVKSFEILQINPQLDIEQIFSNIIQLCALNNFTESARVRLSFSMGQGALNATDLECYYLIESWKLENKYYSHHLRGLSTTVFRQARKTTDTISNIKSASAVVLALAARFSKNENKEDSLILNTKGNIIESTIANIYCIKNQKIYTPPISEGCVDGVLRKILMLHFAIIEKEFSEEFIKTADAVFISNTIKGVQWIRSIDDVQFAYPSILESINTSVLNRYVI